MSQENEAVLKGRVAPKNPENREMEEEKDEGTPKKPISFDEVGMGLNGDVEKQFKMLGFAD